MHIEERLASIDETLKALLAAVQSGNQVVAATEGTPAPESSEPTKRRGRPPKAESAATTGDAAPTSPTASAAAADAPAKTASEPAPSAASAAPAPQASTAASDPSWDDAVAALKSLAANPAHGSAAVLKVIKDIDPSAANVPALKDKGKNAEVIAKVKALLEPAGEPDLF